MAEDNRISQLINTSTPSPSPAPSPAPAAPSGGGGSGTPSPSPAPSPTPPPSPPGGGGEVQNRPDAIDRLARELESKVGPKLQKAASDLGALHLAESAYTAVTYPLAIAYTEASAFMIQDLGSKVERLAEIGSGLNTTAATWREAEDNSTVRGV